MSKAARITGATASLTLVLFAVLHLLSSSGTIRIPAPAAIISGSLYGFLLALATVLAQIGLGNIVFKTPWLRDLDLAPLPGLLFRWTAGFAVLHFLLWFSGMLSILRVLGPMLITTTVVVFAPKGWALAISAVERRNGSTEIRHSARKRKAVFVLLLFVWSAPLLLQSLLPNTDWDGEAYHLPMAERFLEIGIFEVDTIYHWYNYPGSAQLFYAAFLGLGAESAIIPFNLLFAAGIVAAVYALALSFWDRRAARAAAAVCASILLLWEVALSPRIETYLTYFALLSCLAFFLWIHDRNKPGYLLLLGNCLGAAVGFKVTGFFFAAILLPAALFISLCEIKAKGIRALIPLVAAGLFFTFPSSFWYIRNAVELGDPVYPYRSGIHFTHDDGRRIDFQAELSRALKDLPDGEALQAAAKPYGIDLSFLDAPLRRSPKNLFNLWDILRHPENYQRKPYEHTNILIFMGLLIPFFSRSRYAWGILGISAAVYIISGFNTPIIRYALPAFPLMAVASGAVVSNISSKAISRLVAVIIGLFLIQTAVLQGLKLANMQPWRYFSGQETRLDWLSRVGYNTVKTAPPFIKKINDLVEEGVIGPNDTLFLIGEGKGYLLKCRYIPDSSRFGIPWLVELIRADFDATKTAEDLKAREIRFLAVNFDYFEGVARFYDTDRRALTLCLYQTLKFFSGQTRVVWFEDGFLFAEIIPAFHGKKIQTEESTEPCL